MKKSLYLVKKIKILKDIYQTTALIKEFFIFMIKKIFYLKMYIRQLI